MDTRTGINAELQVLASRLEEIISQHGRHDTLARFSMEARLLTERFPDEDAADAYHRINCLLSGTGIIPGQDESEQCPVGD